MLGCSFSHPAKDKIAQMQAAGVPDKTIVDYFIKAYGKGIYRSEPNTFDGWYVPGARVLSRDMVRAPAPASSTGPGSGCASGALHDQIEQECRISNNDYFRRGASNVGVLVFIVSVRARDLPEPEPVSPFDHWTSVNRQYTKPARLQFEFRVGSCRTRTISRPKQDLQKGARRRAAEIDR